ncbi:MAG: phosphoribosylaminoimidazolesuccinocarboxamide synthase [Chthonomonas sp.]|nr:phosphoribosylaminoimidazolesuccinocarboxamide synthase [Chthonomonas sp.]
MLLLDASQLSELKLVRRGKVREVFEWGADELLIVSTDRISAFDAIMQTGIPDKGRILNQMSAFWFENLSDVIGNHVISTDDARIGTALPSGVRDSLRGRTVLARRTTPLPVECVARGYITGSLLKEYRAIGGGVHGLDLPGGLVDGSRLPEPIFTPATKAETGHDENIGFAEVVNVVGQETATRLREVTLELYRRAAAHAESRGLILADTKFEFGLTDDGELIWIDEALTPDSSRYWDGALYQPGQAQPSFDKQYLRDYLETSGWDKNPPGPSLPDDVVLATRAKYLMAYERIVGRPLD